MHIEIQSHTFKVGRKKNQFKIRRFSEQEENLPSIKYNGWEKIYKKEIFIEY